MRLTHLHRLNGYLRALRKQHKGHAVAQLLKIKPSEKQGGNIKVKKRRWHHSKTSMNARVYW